MVLHLGEKLTERLLTEDFYQQINPGHFHLKCNRTSNLENIRRR